MNLYKISQDINDDYDTYDSAVVVAESEDEARMIHPNGRLWDGLGLWSDWVNSDNVTVELIGRVVGHFAPGTVIVSSFNAG